MKVYFSLVRLLLLMRKHLNDEKLRDSHRIQNIEFKHIHITLKKPNKNKDLPWLEATLKKSFVPFPYG